MMPLIQIAALTLAAPPDARDDGAVGHETTIPFAAGGGLRDWQAGPAGSDLLYVRDRRERWYAVTLSGPCARHGALDTLTYTTNVDGRFDLFSRISLRRLPNAVCGVRSIRTSLPPPGQPGAQAPRGQDRHAGG